MLRGAAGGPGRRRCRRLLPRQHARLPDAAVAGPDAASATTARGSPACWTSATSYQCRCCSITATTDVVHPGRADQGHRAGDQDASCSSLTSRRRGHAFDNHEAHVLERGRRGRSAWRETHGLPRPPPARSAEAGRCAALAGRCRAARSAEVGERRPAVGDHAAARRAHEQALLDEERLVDVLDGLGLLADADGEGRQADRAAAELLAQMRRRIARSTLSSPSSSTPKSASPSRAVGGRWRRRRAPRRSRAPGAAAGWRCGACPRRAGRSPAPRRRRRARRGCRRHRATMASSSLGVVVVEPGDEAEAVAQRAGDEARAGGGADEGEAGQVEPDRAGRRALAERRCRAGSPPWPGRGPPRRRGRGGGSRR